MVKNSEYYDLLGVAPDAAPEVFLFPKKQEKREGERRERERRKNKNKMSLLDSSLYLFKNKKGNQKRLFENGKKMAS